MAGLLAGRVLSEHLARVTLIERDPLDGGPEPRRGGAQGRLGHTLLAGGFQLPDRRFPDPRAVGRSPAGSRTRATGGIEQGTVPDYRLLRHPPGRGAARRRGRGANERSGRRCNKRW